MQLFFLTMPTGIHGYNNYHQLLLCDLSLLYDISKSNVCRMLSCGKWGPD